MTGNGRSRHLNEVDPEIAEIVSREPHRQSTQLGLIASENCASRAVLEAADIVVSKSPVPFGDTRLSRWSGIRLGTSKLTTRGMDTQAMVEVASLIDRVLTNPQDESERAAVRDGVRQLCERFPLPYDR